MVPKVKELRELLLDEAHSSKLSIHPGSNKMYQDLRPQFWWTKMKKEIASHIVRCDTCHRVKVDHLRPADPLQLLAIPSWKWEDISMDFIIGHPGPLGDMTSFGLLLIGSPRVHIFFWSRPGRIIMWNCIWKGS